LDSEEDIKKEDITKEDLVVNLVQEDLGDTEGIMVVNLVIEGKEVKDNKVKVKDSKEDNLIQCNMEVKKVLGKILTKAKTTLIQI
jgi:hypothetical protein